MKDLHWFIIFGAILLTPFLPAILRSRCPNCRKRRLQMLDTLKIHGDAETGAFTYISRYRCDACLHLFKRKKSGCLEPSSQEEYKLLEEAAVTVN